MATKKKASPGRPMVKSVSRKTTKHGTVQTTKAARVPEKLKTTSVRPVTKSGESTIARNKAKRTLRKASEVDTGPIKSNAQRKQKAKVEAGGYSRHTKPPAKGTPAHYRGTKNPLTKKKK